MDSLTWGVARANFQSSENIWEEIEQLKTSAIEVKMTVALIYLR